MKIKNTQLDMILKSQSKLFQFSNVMEETFIQYLSLPYIEYMSNSVPHIFSIRVNARPKLIYTPEEWKTLAGLEVRLETQNYEKDNIFYIRMRASQYITFQNEMGIPIPFAVCVLHLSLRTLLCHYCPKKLSYFHERNSIHQILSHL